MKKIYPESIIFDLDGTLIDSVPAIRASLNVVLDLEGIPPMSDGEVTNFVGFGARWMIAEILSQRKRVLPSKRLDDLMSLYFVEYLRVSEEYTKLYDGVYEVLEQFSKKGIKMAICTNKPGPTTSTVLTNLGLSKFFDAVLTENDVKHKKPDPRHIYDTLKAIDKTTGESIFVGDSEADMEAASAAGIRSICVTYGYCHIPFSKIKATAFIDNFRQLPQAVFNMA